MEDTALKLAAPMKEEPSETVITKALGPLDLAKTLLQGLGLDGG